jgi:hypothetical protein
MKRSGKMFSVILGAAFLFILGTMFGPRTAHALVATLVQVANTPAQSVPTWRTDNDGRSVVRLSYGENMADGTAFSQNNALSNYTVPTGSRLVIDSVSLFAYPPTGQKVFAYFFNGSTYTGIPVLFQGTFGPQDYFQNAISVRDYIEPGGQYTVTMGRSNSSGTMYWDVQAVGHLVNCTNGGGC